MTTNNYKIFLFFFYIFIFLNNSLCQEKKYFPKCGVYEYDATPIVLEGIPINKNDPSPKRGLDSENFKDFKIYLDLENLDYEIEQNNLTQYRELYVSSMMKAINTLQKLLKVVPYESHFRISDQNLKDMEIERYDKTKFGDEAYEKYKKRLER